jgi:hypothetical protein
MRKLSFVFVSATLCTAAALAQVSTESTGAISTETREPSAPPVAWVYVSSSSGIEAYDAASNGKLTHITGSPFSAHVGYLVSNGKYVFGSTQSGTDIDAYLIESNGALHYSASTQIPTASDSGCGSASYLTLDHTGASLYNFDYDGIICANNSYQAFKVTESTGKLTYLNNSGGGPELGGPLSFTANNKFAYTSGCFHFSGGIFVFQRNSNGSLTELNINPALPSDPSASYCPALAAADPTNHIAIAVQPYVDYGEAGGPYQLATYTAENSGNLTTKSTSSNMPKVLVSGDTDEAYVTALNMAPSGKLLAVSGPNGLQVFHFNGASPITHFTGLLTADEVDQLYWDNKNHLYAIGNAANKLWIFTVTPTGYSQAPGSPYTIHAPQGLAVLPLPLE